MAPKSGFRYSGQNDSSSCIYSEGANAVNLKLMTVECAVNCTI
jgi:hypothetical protein